MDVGTGDPSNGGLQDIIDSNHTVNMGGVGNPLTLDCMDHAYSLVTANNGRPTHIMTSSRGLRTYQSLCRAAGYEPPKLPWSWYDPATGKMAQSEVPAFNGTPILINDMMVSAGSTTPGHQRIYFMVLGDDGQSGPTRGVTGFVPEARKGSMFIKRETMGVTTVDQLSFNIESVPAEVTLDPTASVSTQKSVWVSFPAGLAIGSQGALSLITNFDPVSDCNLMT